MGKEVKNIFWWNIFSNFLCSDERKRETEKERENERDRQEKRACIGKERARESDKWREK